MYRLKPHEQALMLAAYEFYVSEINILNAEDNITNFLDSTKQIELSISNKLIGLAAAVTGKVAWSDICEIFQCALQENAKSEAIYIGWLASAQQILSSLPPMADHEKFESIIQNCHKILQDAKLIYPRHIGFSFMSGYFAYIYAERCHQNSENFELALSWFQQAKQWQLQDYGEVEDRIIFYIGQCYFALHQWKKSLDYNETVCAAIIANELGDAFVEDLKQNILYARAALKEG